MYFENKDSFNSNTRDISHNHNVVLLEVNVGLLTPTTEVTNLLVSCYIWLIVNEAIDILYNYIKCKWYFINSIIRSENWEDSLNNNNI